MIIRLKRNWVVACVAGLAVMAVLLALLNFVPSSNLYMGTFVHAAKHDTQEVQFTPGKVEDSDERFHRPSKQKALPLKYSFSEFENQGLEEFSKRKFESGRDVIEAFYAALKNAANMEGYSGGCGTVGNATNPYPFAYELLTQQARQKTTLKQFTDSFKGVGHTTLLKILPAYVPEGTPEDTEYFMVEIEVISGFPAKNSLPYAKTSTYFTYYYGIVTVKGTKEGGFRIERIDLLPEDFLCAPYHSWFYLADALVGIVFGDLYKIVDKIDSIEQKGDEISIFASGKDGKYRFDFVRLTNGHDILLHEYRLEDGKWKEVSLLKPEDQIFKLSVLNPNLKGN